MADLVSQIQNVELQFRERLILKDFSLVLKPNTVHVLMGPSGCGKSTVLRLFAGLLRANSGTIQLPEKSVSMVFQEPRLLPWLSVRENILLPLKLKSGKAGSPEKASAPWLQAVNLADSADLFPHQLSGGMKMRAAIARAMITSPQLLLLDEPFAALDEIQRANLQKLLLEIQTRDQLTILFVTHSLVEACQIADELHLMDGKHGKIRETLVRPEGQINFAQLLAAWSEEYKQVMQVQSAAEAIA